MTIASLDPAFVQAIEKENAQEARVALYRDDPKTEVPILGTWKVEKGTVIFAPRFPIEGGFKYRIYIELTDSAVKPFDHLYSTAAKKTEKAKVDAVYPSAETLPENVLRFYIHFDKPMKPGEAFKNLKMLDASGKALNSPFLELEDELWSPDHKRFTLLLDPGRVKQDLLPRAELGPVLESGKEYTLVVNPAWRTADGDTLKEEFRKKFRTGPIADQKLDEKKWKVQSPAAHSKQPIGLKFDRTLDRALLERVIAVEDANGKEIDGDIQIEKNETGWQLTPKQPWKPGQYKIVVREVLEDVCGNRLSGAFEIFPDQNPRENGKLTKIEFEAK